MDIPLNQLSEIKDTTVSWLRTSRRSERVYCSPRTFVDNCNRGADVRNFLFSRRYQFTLTLPTGFI